MLVLLAILLLNNRGQEQPGTDHDIGVEGARVERSVVGRWRLRLSKKGGNGKETG